MYTPERQGHRFEGTIPTTSELAPSLVCERYCCTRGYVRSRSSRRLPAFSARLGGVHVIPTDMPPGCTTHHMESVRDLVLVPGILEQHILYDTHILRTYRAVFTAILNY